MVTLQDDRGMRLIRDIRDKLYAERQTMTQPERCNLVHQNATRMLTEIERLRTFHNDGDVRLFDVKPLNREAGQY